MVQVGSIIIFLLNFEGWCGLKRRQQHHFDNSIEWKLSILKPNEALQFLLQLYSDLVGLSVSSLLKINETILPVDNDFTICDMPDDEFHVNCYFHNKITLNKKTSVIIQTKQFIKYFQKGWSKIKRLHYQSIVLYLFNSRIWIAVYIIHQFTFNILSVQKL